MSNTRVPNDADEKVPRRYSKWDWLILPALSLLTVGCIVETFRLVDMRFFALGHSKGLPCYNTEGATGLHAVPNSVCWEKGSETGWLEYRFNSCGHRTAGECGIKVPGTYRIVMVGSSFGMGYGVPIQDDFATLLQVKLTNETGQKVEVYNESLNANYPHHILLRFDDVIGAHPDMILWAANSEEFKKDPAGNEPLKGPHGFLGHVQWQISNEARMKSLPDVVLGVSGIIHDGLDDSRIGMVTRHFLYQSQSEYVRASLLDARVAESLRKSPDPDWQARLEQIDGDVAKMEDLAKAAGTPFVAVLLPNRAEAAMISMGQWPEGYDPYKLDNDMRKIVTSHGGIYLDILPDFRDIPNPEQYYLPVDSHPDARGHALIADMIAKQFTSGAVPALTATLRKSAAARTSPK